MISQTWRERLLSLAIWLLCLAPIPLVLVPGLAEVNPIQFILRQLGVWALRFVCISLTITPAAKLLRQPWLIRYRRRIGLFAFAFVCLHLTTYVAIDQAFDWPTIGKDIAKRPYITIGMAAFALLIPLAVTSADKLRRKLGPHRWKRLHQAIYLIAPLGVIHYYLLVKADHRPPLIYGAVVLALLGYRFVGWVGDRRKKAKRAAAKVSSSSTA